MKNHKVNLLSLGSLAKRLLFEHSLSSVCSLQAQEIIDKLSFRHQNKKKKNFSVE